MSAQSLFFIFLFSLLINNDPLYYIPSLKSFKNVDGVSFHSTCALSLLLICLMPLHKGLTVLLVLCIICLAPRMLPLMYLIWKTGANVKIVIAFTSTTVKLLQFVIN